MTASFRARTAAIFHMLCALILLAVPDAPTVRAQTGAPSEYLESIEGPADGDGMAGEVDAGAAQAARAASGNAVPGVSQRELGRVEEITVRARRREELLEDTPISITALSETALRENNVQRTEDIEQLVPNLVFTRARTANAARARIRGVGTTTGEAAFDPGVGTYIDGVYLPRGGKIIDVLDISQIEVLRGPQGTLFGKNTVGGAINITTVKPSEDLEGFVFVRPGRFGQIRTRSMVNLPVAVGWLRDKLFARLAFGTANERGYVYNETQDNYESNLNSLTFLGSIRFLPFEDLTVDVSGSWDRTMSHRRGRTCAYQSDALLIPGPLKEQFRRDCESAQPYRVSPDAPNNDYQLSYGVWGTLAYDVGPLGPFDSLEIKSITSWREQKSDKYTTEDIDTTDVFIVRLDTIPGQPGFQQIQQEAQVSATAWDDRINMVGGFFAFWDKGGDIGGDGGGIVQNANGNGDGFKSLGQTEIDNFTWALFFQGTAAVTDWMSLTGGVRYTSDRKRNQIANQILTQTELEALFANPSLASELFAAKGTPMPAGDETFTKWTPMASLSLFLPEDWLEVMHLDHLMGYFNYSQGFRGGGFNAVIDPLQVDDLLSFAPETIENFEIGFKTIGWDQRATLNLSLFYMNFDDIQVLQTVTIENPDSPDNPFVRRITTNAASAESKGLELEGQLVPIDGLQITGNIGLLDAEYTDFTAPDGTDRSGNRFPEPKFTSFLAVQYSIPLEVGSPGNMNGWLTPRVQWSYTGDRYFGALENPTSFQPGYNRLDARLSYDFMDDRAQVALWGTNLTDERYLDAAEDLVGVFGITSQIYAMPIAWGAELSYRFE